MNKPKSSKFKLEKATNIILLKLLIENNNMIFEPRFDEILKNDKYEPYFDKYMIDLYQFLKKQGCFNTSRGDLKAFLHNIYYRYITSSYKKALKQLNLSEIYFNLKIDDARNAIIESTSTYDYIFLDAFSPTKCPSLWSFEFLKLLFYKLNDNGMILTYSNSACVRNAFLAAGFHIGKTKKEGLHRSLGTIAVKNKSLIKNELSEYDLGLLKTKAGIIYRDENLNLSNEAIIENHVKEVNNSDLMSSSKYIKKYRANTGGRNGL